MRRRPTEHDPAETTMPARLNLALALARHERQRDALMQLTRAVGMARYDAAASLRQIAQTAAVALRVERVSIWRYSEARNAIRCVELFQQSTQTHSAGMELTGDDHPAYFAALAQAEVIAADDARRDPRTREFADDYLRPTGITAMLDAPTHVGDALDGVLCNEHVGGPRTWASDEKTFAMAVANLVALVFEQQTRRAAVDALRENERLLQVASRMGHLGAWSVDIPSMEHRWTDEARRIHEVEPHVRFTVKQLMDFYPPGDRERLIGRFERCATAGTPFDEEFRFVTGRTRARWVRVIGEAVLGVDGAVVRVHGAIQDLTDRKRLEEQQLRAERLESLATLGGGIAHDLNNALTPILMSVGLLQEEERDPEQQAVLKNLEASTRRAAALVDQVLQFVRDADAEWPSLARR